MKSYYLILVAALTFFTSCSKDEPSEELEIFQVMMQSEITIIDGDYSIATNRENELFEIVNNYRESIHLTAFNFEEYIYNKAVDHTNFMVSQGYTSHDKFAQRAEDISNTTGAVEIAENVANDYPTIEEAFEAWLESPEHRKSIEGDYSHSAISIKEDHNGNLYFTQIFIR